MLPHSLWYFCLTTIGATATTTSSADFFSRTFSTIANPTTPEFTGTQYTYPSYSVQSTVTTSSGALNASSSETQSTRSAATDSVTHIGGSAPTTGTNGTSTATSTANAAENTVPCNNYPEFCNRKYSNITEVCAHNSAFAIRNNAASNQIYGIIDQLNDGVRMRELTDHTGVLS